MLIDSNCKKIARFFGCFFFAFSFKWVTRYKRHCPISPLGMSCLQGHFKLQRNIIHSCPRIPNSWHRYFSIFYICQRKFLARYFKKLISNSIAMLVQKSRFIGIFKKKLMFPLRLCFTVWYILQIFMLSFLRQTPWNLSWIQLLKSHSVYMQM